MSIDLDEIHNTIYEISNCLCAFVNISTIFSRPVGWQTPRLCASVLSPQDPEGLLISYHEVTPQYLTSNFTLKKQFYIYSNNKKAYLQALQYMLKLSQTIYKV